MARLLQIGGRSGTCLRRCSALLPRRARESEFSNFPYRIPAGTGGHYEVREIQAVAVATAAQHAGRPFSYGNFMSPPGDSSDSDDVDDITFDENAGSRSTQNEAPGSYNYDDHFYIRINDVASVNNEDDNDDDNDENSHDNNEQQLWP